MAQERESPHHDTPSEGIFAVTEQVANASQSVVSMEGAKGATPHYQSVEAGGVAAALSDATPLEAQVTRVHVVPAAHDPERKPPKGEEIAFLNGSGDTVPIGAKQSASANGEKPAALSAQDSPEAATEGGSGGSKGAPGALDAPKLSPKLVNLLPPKAEGEFWKERLPGRWREPGGFGAQEGTTPTLTGGHVFWWAFWWLVRDKPKAFATCLFIIACQGVVTFYTPVITAIVIANLSDLENAGDEAYTVKGLMTIAGYELTSAESSWVSLSFLVLVFFLDNELSYFLSTSMPIGGKFIPSTRCVLVEHFTQLPLMQVESAEEGEVMSVVQDDVETLNDAVAAFLGTISAAVMLASVFVVMSTMAWQMTILVFAILPAILLLTRRTGPRLSHASEEKLSQNANFRKTAGEIIRTGVTIRLLGLGSMCNRLTPVTLSLQKSFGGLKSENLFSTRVVGFLQRLSRLGIISVGAVMLKYSSSDLATGEVVAIYNSSGALFASVTALVVHYRTFQIAAPSITRLAQILSRPPKPIESTSSGQASGVLDIVDLSFKYPRVGTPDGAKQPSSSGSGSPSEAPEDPAILSNCTMQIEPGLKVAIVGVSGSGKSTLLKCIANHYPLTEGEILYSSTPMSKVDLYSTVSMLQQDYAVFDGTIAENIRGGRDVQSAVIDAAATAACITGVEDSAWMCPQGVETPCGANGSLLSFSLKQRVALGRVLAADTPVYLLDDPLSGHDYKTKMAIVDRLARLQYQGRNDATVLAVVKDDYALQLFDRVAFLHQGQVAEYGPYEELMKAKGQLFRFLTRMHAIIFDNEGKARITANGLRDACWLFHGADNDLMEALSDRFVSRHVAKGEQLFARGDPCSTFYIVARGTFYQEFYFAPEGTKGEDPVVYGAGEVREAMGLCDMPLYARSTQTEADDFYPASAHATGDDAVVLSLSEAAMDEVLTSNKALEEMMFSRIADVDSLRSKEHLQAAVWALAGVPLAELEELASRTAVHITKVGEVLIAADLPISSFFIVVSGEVKVKPVALVGVRRPKGKDSRMLGRGECFGVACMTGGERDCEEAVVVEEGLLLCLDEALFAAWKQCFPRGAAAIEEVCADVARIGSPEAIHRTFPFSAAPLPACTTFAQCWAPVMASSSEPPRASDGAFVVVRGELKLLMEDSEGGLTKRVLGAGEMLSVHSLLGLVPEVRVLQVEVADVAVLLKCSQELYRAFEDAMAGSEEWGAVKQLAKKHLDLTAKNSLSTIIASQTLNQSALATLQSHCLHATPQLRHNQPLSHVLPTGSSNGVLVVSGSLCWSAAAPPPSDAASVPALHTAIPPGTAVAPSAVKEMLYGDLEATSMPGAMSPRDSGPQSVVFFHGHAGSVLGQSETCVLVELAFESVSEAAQEAAAALRVAFEKAEEERRAAIQHVKAQSKEKHDLAVRLGQQRRLDVPWMWRRALLRVRFMFAMGNIEEITQRPLEEGRLEGAAASKLEILARELARDLRRMREIEEDRIAELNRVRRSWLEAGLPEDDPEGPADTHDLSWTRLGGLKTTVATRLQTSAAECERMRADVERMWSFMRSKPELHLADPTTEIRQQVAKHAKTGDLASLVALEDIVHGARAQLQPYVQRCSDDLTSRLARMSLSDEERSHDLQDMEHWDMDRLARAEWLLKLLQSQGNGGGSAGDKVQMAMLNMKVNKLGRGAAESEERAVAAAVEAKVMAKEKEEMARELADMRRQRDEAASMRDEAIAQHEQAASALKQARMKLDSYEDSMTDAQRAEAAKVLADRERMASKLDGLASFFGAKRKVQAATAKIATTWLRYVNRRGPLLKVADESELVVMQSEYEDLQSDLGVTASDGSGVSVARLPSEWQQLKQFKELRDAMDAYVQCTEVWDELGVSAEDRKKIFSDMIQSGKKAGDPGSLAQYMGDMKGKLVESKQKQQVQRLEWLDQCAADAKALGLKPAHLEAIRKEVGDRVTVASMATLDSKVQQLAAWKEISKLQKELASKAAEVQTALGFVQDEEQRTGMMAQAKLEQEEVQKRIAELEAQFGKVPDQPAPVVKAPSRRTKAPLQEPENKPKKTFLKRRQGSVIKEPPKKDQPPKNA